MNNKMSGLTIAKRVMAFFIDFLVVGLISSSLIYLPFINPEYDEYVEASNNYKELVDKYYDEEIDRDELMEKASDYNYQMNKYGYVYTIGEIVVVFLYFGVFAYITKGQTLGKKLFSLQIISSEEGKELKLHNYFIRAFILDSVIYDIIVLIAINFKQGTYEVINTWAQNFDTLLILVIFLMIMFTNYGRGLHDYLAKTRVICLKEEKLKEAEAIINSNKGKDKNE